MKKLICFVIPLVLMAAVPASAAYIPDNNGRFVWSGEQKVVRTAIYKKKYKRHAVKRSKGKRVASDANGNRARGKTPPWNMVQVVTVQGFKLTVHPAYAHKFLRFFEILEQNHVRVPKELVGCYARGHHVRGSNHYIGAACDIQSTWNGTIPALYTKEADRWIREAGLYNGCSFGDCGHIEAVRGTHNRPPPLMAALEKFKAMQSTANYQP